MVKGKAGRQLPGEACADIGIGIGISIGISICCLGLAAPRLEPGLGEEAAPQQGASLG